ncbi:multidrug transporter [Vibrio breoganii]|uniref:Multidrug transporter n=1 Tax=Vibrio breoganii TaxID=553239 RepID=A0AAN0XY48_9VIBR|nr:biotin/lipoyl-binding protein [Vibrio breoganii]ANO34770.1 multidrug transporter [Vibrio breoganii]PMG77699.1 multidrug transporter [Vibrio breoganii]PMK42206.1 multidrug transporter [Vibrio breoganii]
MLEGLAVWALFIYLLRLIGMPWNKGTKGFAYVGGSGWLVFVWIGLINYTPMDLSGGSVVQAPHVQLRPGSTKIKGKVTKIHVSPNQEVSKGDLIYEIDPQPYQIALNQAPVELDSTQVSYDLAKEDIAMAKSDLKASHKITAIEQSKLKAAYADLKLKRSTLERYVEQEAVVKHSVTEAQLEEQQTLVTLARLEIETIKAEISKYEVDAEKSALEIEKSELILTNKKNDIHQAMESLHKAQWDLKQTKVYAPLDGYLTNFILREGQLVSTMPRLHMYTNEKYVLMRVNHQAIRNVEAGQFAEFSSPVFPGKVFAAEVEGIVEATGESQGSLLSFDPNVRTTTGKNVNNKHHFVRLKIHESERYDIPVGLAWISGDKPASFMNFLDAIRGIIIRMKSQIYFLYSM